MTSFSPMLRLSSCCDSHAQVREAAERIQGKGRGDGRNTLPAASDLRGGGISFPYALLAASTQQEAQEPLGCHPPPPSTLPTPPHSPGLRTQWFL